MELYNNPCTKFWYSFLVNELYIIYLSLISLISSLICIFVSASGGGGGGGIKSSHEELENTGVYKKYKGEVIIM